MTRTDAELFALLRPWHATLLACDRVVSSPATRVLWVSASSEHVGHVAGALDLLALVTRISTSALDHAIVQLWPHYLVNWHDDEWESVAPPRFVLGLSVTVRHLHELAPLGDWLTGGHDLSDAYVRVRELLVSLPGSSERATAVPVRLHCQERNEEHAGDTRIDEILRALVPLAILQQLPTTRQAEGIAPRTPFEIREVEFEGLEIVIHVASLGYMGRLAECGVSFNHLPAIHDPFVKGCSVRSMRALHRLLAVPGQTSTVSRGVQTLAVLDDTPWPLLLAVLSAAHVSSTLRHVRVKTTGTRYGIDVMRQRFDLWEWVAYLFMSRQANPTIRKLDPDVDDLTIADVARMQRVTQVQDPFTEILYPQPTAAGKLSPVWISARRFYLVDPKKETIGPSTILTLDTSMVVRRVHAPDADSPWWRVLAPGCGLVWLHPDDATPLSDDEAPHPVSTSAPKEVFLGTVFENDMAATSALLQLLGNTLQLVEADGINGGERIDEWYHDLCVNCPNVDRLVLRDVSFQSTQTIIDAYANGACHARVLHLDGFNCTDSPRHVQQLFEVLADASHPMARHVQDLNLWIRIDEPDDFDILDGLHRLLARNRRLYAMHVSISADRMMFPTLDCEELERAFDDQYNAEQLAIRTGPLPIRRKLALLSAVHDKSSGSRALQLLDSSVLSIVFEFAALRRVRRVKLEVGVGG